MQLFMGIIICLVMSLSGHAHAADIDGLYPPMGLEPDLLEPPRVEGMVFVKGGCFDMGDTFGDGDSDEKPVHEVCVDDFYIGKYEVTQKAWNEVITWSYPSRFNGCSKCPVENVSWNDIQEFLIELNRKSAKQYRLPTEAEWEYAAREEGRKIKWAGTNRSRLKLNEYAWYEENSGRRPHPVGQRKPNALGLFDMSGNVAEWVNDWYGENYYRNSPKYNPYGPAHGEYRVLRGGSWSSSRKNVTTMHRIWSNPDDRYSMFGFRLALPATVQE